MENHGGSFRTYHSKICSFAFPQKMQKKIFGFVFSNKNHLLVVFPRKYSVVFSREKNSLTLSPQVKKCNQKQIFFVFRSKIICLTLFSQVKIFSVFVSASKYNFLVFVSASNNIFNKILINITLKLFIKFSNVF